MFTPFGELSWPGAGMIRSVLADNDASSATAPPGGRVSADVVDTALVMAMQAWDMLEEVVVESASIRFCAGGHGANYEANRAVKTLNAQYNIHRTRKCLVQGRRKELSTANSWCTHVAKTRERSRNRGHKNGFEDNNVILPANAGLRVEVRRWASPNQRTWVLPPPRRRMMRRIQ